MVRATALALVLCWLPVAASAQTAAPRVPQTAATPALNPWAVTLSANIYLGQEDGDFAMPVFTADRGALHLEGRYQYEDRRTVSAWAGWNLGWGSEVRLDVVPMAGVIVGRTNGLAPGVEATLSWKTLEAYSEWEYVLDIEGKEGDYGYTWSTFTWQVTPWLAVGAVAQRTRLYKSELEIERGPFAAATWGRATLSVYGFNLDGESPFAVVAFAWDF